MAHIASSEKGRSDAEADWAKERAQFLENHEGFRKVPGPLRAGFYVSESSESDAYVSAYNRRLRELISRHGTPTWAPGARLPSEIELREAVDHLEPLSMYVAASKKEGWLVRAHIRSWRDELAVEPAGFRRLDDRRIIILSGPVGAGLRVDLIDVKDMVWMARIELVADGGEAGGGTAP